MNLHALVKPCTAALLLAIAPLAPGAHAQAQELSLAQEIAPGLDDTQALHDWLDGYVSAHLQGGRIAGASVAVVSNGEVLALRGYGFADVASRTAVDPSTTLFRIGSVTKLFTWTAVMQLREQGLLDLDTDVNEYLDFQIPESYAEPITLRHLLTHTAGFEDRAYGLFAPASGLTRSEWMEHALPARVRPPGVLPAYSNYGSALAGYIVERAAGMPWEDYIDRHLLRSLGVQSITSRQPLPENLTRDMSTGYSHESGRLVPMPFETVELAPAGSISASAEAMATFMLAHLGGGAHGESRILADSTTREMHERAFAVDTRVNGMALGFYEKSSHGLRMIGHSGGTQWFFTDLTLIPSEQLGIFITTNTAGDGGLLAGGLTEAFLDRYFPAPVPELPAVLEGWSDRAEHYAGNYRSLRRSYTTFEKFISPLFDIPVAVGESGEIAIRTPLKLTTLREVEPGYFREPHGTLEVAFVPDESGGYSHLLLGSTPPTAMERVQWWQSTGLHLLLLAVSILLLASAIVLPGIRFAMQRGARRAGQPTLPPLEGAERWLRWAATGFATLIIGFVVILGGAFTERAFVTAATGNALQVALALPMMALPLGLAVVAGAVLAFRNRYWSRWGRIHYLLLTLAVVALTWQLAYWNLLGWKLG